MSQHLCCTNVCVARVGITIKQYFKPAPKSSCASTSMTPEDLKQLTQKIKDQLEESVIEKVT